MATVLANPYWPAMGFEVDFQTGPPHVPGATRVSIDAVYRRLAVRKWDTGRGRQYELDQTQAGIFNATVYDPLEQLNPDNTASPYNAGSNDITPYRCTQVWAVWPNQPGSGNLINTTVNVNYDPSFELNPGSLLGLWTIAGGTTTRAQSGVQHFSGTKSLLVTQSAAGTGFGVVNSFPTSPTLTYTFSAYVFPTSGAVTLQVADAAGTVHTSATASTLNVWTRLSVTWNSVDTLEPITVYGTGVSTPTFFLDATMLEYGASVNTFATTGPTFYPIYTGYVEQYPTQYTMSGMLAIRPLVAVDALAILARTTISQNYETTIAADQPTIYIPWSNKAQAVAGGALGSDALAHTNSTFVINGVPGNPKYLLSPSGSIAWTGDQQPDGTDALVISQQNANTPPIPGGSNQDTSVDIINSLMSFDTVNGGMIEGWVKSVAGQMAVGVCFAAAAGLDTNATSFSGGVPLIGFVTNGGALTWQYDPTGSNFYQFTTGIYPDSVNGQWHYMAITVAGGSMSLNLDGVDSGAITVVSASRIGFTYICHISANCGLGDPQSQVSFGRWAFYNHDPGSAARLAHYNRGAGYINEVSGNRVARLLAAYWGGAFAAAAGYSLMAPDFNYDTTATTSGGDGTQRVMLDVLQEIQETERGLVFAATSGSVWFRDRTSNYFAGQTALWVFGENPTGASPTEYPYSSYEAVVDPTYTFSQANLTRPNNSTFAPVINTTTQAKYGQRILSQQVQCNLDFDLWQVAIFYLNRYATPKTRISKLTLNPSSNPALWPVALSLELQQRVTVRRRNASLTISGDYYIEQINHRVDSDSGDWTVDLQLSPVFVPTAWVLGDSTYGVLGTSTVPVY